VHDRVAEVVDNCRDGECATEPLVQTRFSHFLPPHTVPEKRPPVSRWFARTSRDAHYYAEPPRRGFHLPPPGAALHGLELIRGDEKRLREDGGNINSSTGVHARSLFSADSSDLRDFRGRRDARLPLCPASELDGKEGVSGSSPEEDLKFLQIGSSLLPEQTRCCRAVWRGHVVANLQGLVVQRRSKTALREL
jgi:hypothetical protein